jgi:cell division protein FtsL
MAMSPAPAAMLGKGAGGHQRERLRTVDTPTYGQIGSRGSQTRPGAEQSSGQSNGQRRNSQTHTTQGHQVSRYITSGALALADPTLVPHTHNRVRQTGVKNPRPVLRVLSGGKSVGKTRKKILVGLSIVALVTIAFAAVFMHASLARTQLGIDKLNVEITQAERMNQRLRVQVATLEAPDRIVSVAQELGLEPPKTVRFLPTAAPIALAATRIVR